MSVVGYLYPRILLYYHSEQDARLKGSQKGFLIIKMYWGVYLLDNIIIIYFLKNTRKTPRNSWELSFD